MRSMLMLLALLTLPAPLTAQSTRGAAIPQTPGPGAPAFEVASVKPGNPDPGRLFGFMPLPNGRLRVISVPVSLLIEQSYGLRSFQVVGAPEWTRSARFDIEARAPEGTPPTAMMEMMRHLLADRFKLQAHVETRDIDVYALVLARPDRALPSTLSRTIDDCDAILAEDAKRLAANPNGMIPARIAADGRRVCGGMIRNLVVDGRPMTEYLSGGETMGELASFLGDRTERLVIDRTGLTGRFNFDLQYSRLGVARTGAPAAPAGPAAVADLGVSIEDAVLPLGLKLQSERAPIQVLVIDGIERPTAD